ncbi:MAG TPA: maleylpyruvate isomerase family mycothiol-dependent enzyme [Actinomycetota bacterium]|nr:maleylpyruvate isomerase family mycothiol-dependent enzyme [Actinomycetota bacterium]
MPDIAEVYTAARKEFADFVAGLSDDELARDVPATPGWSVHDVVAHISGVVRCVAAGDFPAEFFADIGAQPGIVVLNEWTAGQVEAGRPRPLNELLDEWADATEAIMPMLRGDEPWPGDVVPFAAYILTCDLGVHQHDVYGALGIVRDRDSTPVKIGFSVYTGGLGVRARTYGKPALRIVTETKDVTAGDGEPAATVRGSRFELFRALSGRRSLDQLRSYDWEGDPEPFLELFYPYGIREDALVE